MDDVGERRAAEQDRPLKNHGLAQPDCSSGGPPTPQDGAGAWLQQPVQQSQQQALASAVRAHDHRAHGRPKREIEPVDQAPPAGLEYQAASGTGRFGPISVAAAMSPS